MPTRAGSTITNDHDKIRRWAEERGARPACVRGTGEKGDIGILRLDFPGYSGADSLEHISWDDFFEKFDERGLALLHQDTTARGQKSNFNKLISRETAQASGSRRRASSSRSRTSARASSRPSTGRRKPASRSASTRSETKTAAKRKSSRSRSASSRESSRNAARSRSARKAAGSRSRSSARKSASTRSRRNTTSTPAARKSAATRSPAARTRRRRSSSGRSSASTRATSRSAPNRQRRTSTRSQSSRSGAGRSSKSHILTDHREIRRWAEERKAKPACVRGTGRKKNDTGMIRLDFPGFSGAQSLKPINWNTWFESFDDNNLALVVQDQTARGQRSNFNKLIGRETAQARQQGSHASRRHPERGRKVTSISSRRGSRAQAKSARGSTRGARTASSRSQHRGTERRAA